MMVLVQGNTEVNIINAPGEHGCLYQNFSQSIMQM